MILVAMIIVTKSHLIICQLGVLTKNRVLQKFIYFPTDLIIVHIIILNAFIFASISAKARFYISFWIPFQAAVTTFPK